MHRDCCQGLREQERQKAFMMPWQQRRSSRGACWIGTQMRTGGRLEGAFPESFIRCSWMERQSITGVTLL